MADLEIRGAGNLLGDEQCGPRRRASASRCTRRCSRRRCASCEGEQAALAAPVRVDLPVDRLRAARVHRLRGEQDRRPPAHRAGPHDLRELGDVRAELGDRFGPPPEPVENLLTLQAIRLKAAELAAAAVAYRGGRLQLDGLDLDDDWARACVGLRCRWCISSGVRRSPRIERRRACHARRVGRGSPRCYNVLPIRKSRASRERSFMKKRVLAIVALAAVAAVVLTGCGRKVPAGAVAAVGNGVVTRLSTTPSSRWSRPSTRTRPAPRSPKRAVRSTNSSGPRS